MNAAVQAVIFDVDGVLTNTATLHFAAWTALFDDILPPTAPAFTRSDYERLVDGRPRLDGLRAVLADRAVVVDETSVARFAEQKQRQYLDLISDRGVDVFADVVPCLQRLAAHEIPAAAASASRNARAVLDSADLTDRFAAVVDGTDAAQRKLAGKPAPDLFVAAAADLGYAPTACALVEDALSGVQAGRNGSFGLVVALDRSHTRGTELLPWSDLVIVSLDQLPLDRFAPSP